MAPHALSPPLGSVCIPPAACHRTGVGRVVTCGQPLDQQRADWPYGPPLP